MNRSRRTALRGFSLLELMSTMAVSAILICAGVPSMRDYVLANNRSAAALGLYGALNVARSEAIARNTIVTVCRGDQFVKSDRPFCNSSRSGEWTSGWVIYAADGAAVLFAQDALTDNVSIEHNTPGAIQFDPSGHAADTANFDICDVNARIPGRRVSVSPSGRISLAGFDGCAVHTAAR